jgi:hypothetical protein
VPISVLHPSSNRPFLIYRPRHHVFPNASFSKRKTALCRMMACSRPHASLFWGKFPAEWCFLTKLGPQVSLFPVPIFGVNSHHIDWSSRSVLPCIGYLAVTILSKGHRLPSRFSIVNQQVRLQQIGELHVSRARVTSYFLRQQFLTIKTLKQDLTWLYFDKLLFVFLIKYIFYYHENKTNELSEQIRTTVTTSLYVIPNKKVNVRTNQNKGQNNLLL